jgi:hypothetical protein
VPPKTKPQPRVREELKVAGSDDIPF